MRAQQRGPRLAVAGAGPQADRRVVAHALHADSRGIGPARANTLTTGWEGGGRYVRAEDRERAATTEGHPRGRVDSQRHAVAEQPPLERAANRRSFPERVPRVEAAAN